MLLIVRHKIEDYAKWKTVFDETEEDRRKAGLKTGWITHVAGDLNDLAVVFEFDDIGRVRQFMQSGGLRDAMQRAGVVGQPEILFLNEIERISEAVPSAAGWETDWL